MVAFDEVHLEDFRRGNDAYLSSCLIAERARHSQPWNVFLEVPDAQRTKWVTLDVAIRLNTTSVPQNASFLIRFVCLVVTVQGNSEALLALADLSNEDGARITDVSAENFGANDKN